MPINANLGKEIFKEKNILDSLHPPIIVSMKAKNNNGELSLGQIVAKNNDGEIVKYDPAGSSPINKPVGILMSKIDTQFDNIANVLRHGTVIKSEIVVGDGSVPPTEADFEKLREIFIFPI